MQKPPVSLGLALCLLLSCTVGGANEHHPVFFEGALKEMPGKFTNGVNAAMIVKKTSGHDYNAWLADFYNVMLVFFK